MGCWPDSSRSRGTEGITGFLVDTKTRGSHQHRGIGRELLRQAAENAKAAGCEWLHVDFEPHLARFYPRPLRVSADRRRSHPSADKSNYRIARKQRGLTLHPLPARGDPCSNTPAVSDEGADAHNVLPRGSRTVRFRSTGSTSTATLAT